MMNIEDKHLTLAEGIEAHGLDTKAILAEINALIKE